MEGTSELGIEIEKPPPKPLGYCWYCNTKLRRLKADDRFPYSWKRKYHKSCWIKKQDVYAPSGAYRTSDVYARSALRTSEKNILYNSIVRKL